MPLLRLTAKHTISDDINMFVMQNLEGEIFVGLISDTARKRGNTGYIALNQDEIVSLVYALDGAARIWGVEEKLPGLTFAHEGTLPRV